MSSGEEGGSSETPGRQGHATKSRSNPARAPRAIRAIVPTDESETTNRAGLHATVGVEHSQPRCGCFARH
jgi:hypothetical protein